MSLDEFEQQHEEEKEFNEAHKPEHEVEAHPLVGESVNEDPKEASKHDEEKAEDANAEGDAGAINTLNSPGVVAEPNSVELAKNVKPADREQTKEEKEGKNAPGADEKKVVETHLHPSPFSPNSERELFIRDPEEYQKSKLGPATVLEPGSEELRSIEEGTGTHTTDAVKGVRASNEERSQAEKDQKEQLKKQEEEKEKQKAKK